MKTVEFKQPRVVIGRSPDCDLVLGGADVSRTHAAIERDRDGWTLVDLDSRYGTFVNRQGTKRHPLKQGDEIRLGLGSVVNLVLVFHLTPEPPRQEVHVQFDDQAQSGQVRMTLDVEDFERSMGGRLPEPPRAKPAEAPVAPEPAASSDTDNLRLPRAGVSIVGLFNQVGLVLLTSEDLGEMLGKVADLALEHLPAQRSSICLCDATGQNITPQATRIKESARRQSINISRSIAREAIRARQAILVSNAPDDARFARAPSVVIMGIRSAMCAPLYHAGRVEGLIYVDTLSPDLPFDARDLELLTALGVLTGVGILQARLRDDVNRERAIRARLSRYSSPHVVDQIVAGGGGHGDMLLAAERQVTVLFADLSGFTSMAEGLEPAQVAEVLNSAFEHLTRAVFQYDGTLDKYLGDGLLAIFGAPLPQRDHAERAIRAALEMQRILEEGTISGPQGEPLRMRIGVNSGTAVAGDIGSPVRKDYTAIGDAINVASRLESSVAEPGQIVIGPDTYQRCKETFECRALPEIRLRGKQQVIRPYLVIG